MTASPEQPAPEPSADTGRSSLGTQAARNLTTTTKTVPQMEAISSRWLLRKLPWVNVSGGAYRVNRRLNLRTGRGRVVFVQEGADDVRIVPETLTALPVLRGFGDAALLAELARRFSPRDFESGEVIVEAGAPVQEVFILAHGKAERLGTGPYGDTQRLGVLADGDQLGDEALDQADPTWPVTVRALTAGTVMALRWPAFRELLDGSPGLQAHIADYLANADKATNRKGEAAIAMSAGHVGEPELDGTFVDYDLAPREYELSLAQTVLRVHSRVADLYNDPMVQLEQQLRLTVEAIRERQEWELVNNREFGLLHNTAYDQRISTSAGPPTPDDMDALLTMRRGTKLFLAHPRTIAAFLGECSKRGLYPGNTNDDGHDVPAWRGVPIYPCGKIPVSAAQTSPIIAMRLGEDQQGVVGLHHTGLPEEYEPSLNVRFMGIDDRAIINYLVTAYYSAAILVPDAIGVLENAEIAVSRTVEGA